METFEHTLARLKTTEADPYAYATDIRKALRDALDIIEGLLTPASPVSDERYHRNQDGLGE